jgi:hypothetical protein
MIVPQKLDTFKVRKLEGVIVPQKLDTFKVRKSA